MMFHLNYVRSAVSSYSNRCCRACPHQPLQFDMRLNNNTRRRIINPQRLFALRSKSNSSSSSQNYPFSIHDDDNPFEILGVPKTSSYEVVKRRFVELALKHHPDVSNNKNDDDNNNNNENDSSSDSNIETSNNTYDRDRNMEIFIRLRKAFETIRENEDGTTRLYDNNGDGDSSCWSDDEFFAWFYEETGHQDVMFKMDVKTRKEVIEVVKTDQSQGGLDKGGMWELARSMAQEEDYLLLKKNRKKGAMKTNKAFKGIDSGQTPQPKIRRRRR